MKVDVAGRFYHVYARGNNRQLLYREARDYAVFLNLLKRYLSSGRTISPTGYAYPHLYGDIELVCFCLMPNHFHMLLYQATAGSMEQLMRGLMPSYSRMFNRRYERTGTLYESKYMAAPILDDAYLQHITRYIHRNPVEWRTYPYSSLPFYFGLRSAEWIRPERILELFESAHDYGLYLEAYKDLHAQTAELVAESA